MDKQYAGKLFGLRNYEAKPTVVTAAQSHPAHEDIERLSDTLRQTYGKEFLTVSDIEKYTGFSEYTIRKLVRENIPSKLVGRSYIVHVDAFASWILEREVK